MVTAVILAAGGSSRLGTPKQLLLVRGRSLLRRAAETACASRAGDVIVVLGADASRMRGELQGLRVRVIENPSWREGISSSIRSAVSSLQATTDAVLLMLCDQPRLTSAHVDMLIGASERSPGCPVASFYGGSAGVPAIFPRTMFGDLLLLEGETGAKGLLRKHSDILLTIPFPGGTIDVDAASDVPGEL
jgi:molybdenum cofactor cytidylyltransferase